MAHSYSSDGKGVPFSPELHRALISARAHHRESIIVLRDAICAYASDLRNRGVPANEIKSVIRQRLRGLRPTAGSETIEVSVDGIVDDLLASCFQVAPAARLDA